MTPDAREQARHKASVMIAFAEGKTIQVSHPKEDNWKDTDTPDWAFDCRKYRVKPEERKPVEVTVWFNRDGSPYATELGCSSEVVQLKTRRFFREVLPETETE